jgi:hypothetical protein
VNAHAVAMTAHIAGGTLAFATGATALGVRKGGRAHSRAGTLFLAAMLALLTSGFGLAVAKADGSVAVSAILWVYLVSTARATARRRDSTTGRFERAALAVAIGCALTQLAFGLLAATSASGRLFGYPAPPHFALAAIAALCAALDLNFIRLGQARPAQRVARHAWRMSVAPLGAVGTFLGQQKVMPASWQGSPWLLVPPLAVLAVTIFWLFRIRFAGAFRTPVPARA